jgi:hypothetical protein
MRGGTPRNGGVIHTFVCNRPSRGIGVTSSEWDSIASTIRHKGVEAALHEVSINEELTEFIRSETAKLFLSREASVVREVLGGTRTLRLSRLFPHLPQDGRVQIITTNYDRLIELAADLSGFKVDTKSFGLYYAPFSKTAGSYAYCDHIEWVGKAHRKVERKVVSIYKPHGSLDWTVVNGTTIRSGFPIGPDRCLIITPGQNKYRAGYDQPFDMQRELANKAIDEAQRFFVIGYGFNDDHLETHLSTKIASGSPTVIMARSLTPNARSLLSDHPNLMALESDPNDATSTLIHFRGATLPLGGQQLWDVERFSIGVMGA